MGRKEKEGIRSSTNLTSFSLFSSMGAWAQDLRLIVSRQSRVTTDDWKMINTYSYRNEDHRWNRRRSNEALEIPTTSRKKNIEKKGKNPNRITVCIVGKSSLVLGKLQKRGKSESDDRWASNYWVRWVMDLFPEIVKYGRNLRIIGC